MLQVYPLGSGSFYTASYALRSEYALSASVALYATTASYADTILLQRSGSRGTGICVLTFAQYLQLSASINTPPNKFEICNFD